jgi:hypothetical protein
MNEEHTPTLENLLAGVTSPLQRQLQALALISRLLKERGKAVPVLIGGCALAYYSREVYFTSDIDLACSDREALDEVLKELGFVPEGRYWVHHGLNLLVEAPAGALVDEHAPREIVEMADGLECCIIGIEDLLIDRMNACVHWKSTQECELVELLASMWNQDIEWEYLLERAASPENDTRDRFTTLRRQYAT